jgi:hypothetical protein
VVICVSLERHEIVDQEDGPWPGDAGLVVTLAIVVL